MKRLQRSWDDKNTQENLKICLDSGSIVVSTTDTVLGLVAPLTIAGFESLNRIKGRQEKPYLILISDASKLDFFIDRAHISSAAQCLIEQCWPGPLTLIFDAGSSLPKFLKSSDNKIALRVPQHNGLRELLMHYHGLFSTSANITGQPVPNTIDELDPTIVENCAMLVSGISGNDRPSTIVDCSGESLRIVREGVYSKETLSRLCDVRFE